MITQTKITLVILGYIDTLLDIEQLQAYKSKLFRIIDVRHRTELPPPENNDGYWDVKYSAAEINNLMPDIQNNGLVIGIMGYRFNDNFYMHRAGENKCCISLSEVRYLLKESDISIESFVLKNIYEAVSLYEIFNRELSDAIYEFPHVDSRGCLFDMNGDVRDIVLNTEKPVICAACKSKANGKSLPSGYIDILEKELKRIDKTNSKKIELWIRKHPLLSTLISFIVSAGMSILVNLLTK